MNAFNEFFKNLAEKMNLPDFFKGTTLLFNNLFLVLFTALCLIALLLVIFLVPGKKKKKAAAPVEEAAEPAPEAIEEAPAEEAEEAPVEEVPAEEPAPEVVEEPIEEPVKEEVPAEESVEEPAEEPVEEAPVEEAPVEEAAPEVVEEAPAEEPAPEVVEEVAVEEAPAEEPVAEAAEEPVLEEEEEEEVLDEGLTDEYSDDDEAEDPIEFVDDDDDAPIVEEKGAKGEEKIKNGGKYEIIKKHGGFYFLLKANNGQLLLESSGYTTLAGAKKAVETFKKAVEVGEFSIDVDKNGNFKFILRTSARSQMHYHGETYSTRQSAEKAILSVKKFAFKSVVKRVEENDEEDAVETMPVVTKPLAPEENKMGGKYVIEERFGKYYFLLKANNGQLLLESPAFTSEQGAIGGIETFKKAAATGIFVTDMDKKGKFRFILRLSASSHKHYFGESYSTRQSAENSVHSVRAFAQNAVLKQ